MSGKTYGNLSFESSSGAWSTLALTGGTATTIQGSFSIGSNVTFNNNALVGLNVGANWTNNGTFTAGSGTVTFNGTAGDQTIGGSSVTAFNNLTVAGIGSGAGSNSVVVIPTTNTPTVAGTLTNNGGKGVVRPQRHQRRPDGLDPLSPAAGHAPDHPFEPGQTGS